MTPNNHGIAIIIPARYGSKRFPGKPLAKLANKEILGHVLANAMIAAEKLTAAQIVVATDDERIKNYCDQNNFMCVMTEQNLSTGTDRVLAAAHQLSPRPDIILNLQGDSPFVYPDIIHAVITALISNQNIDIATPVTQLSWRALDILRASKQTTPFSGTTVIRNPDGTAHWFSKAIIPALKTESKIRGSDDDLSPIFRHIGLYAFRYEALAKFAALPPSYFETLEELEQLRALEAGMKILTVPIDYKNRPTMTGIDSPEDLTRAETLLNIPKDQ